MSTSSANQPLPLRPGPSRLTSPDAYILRGLLALTAIWTVLRLHTSWTPMEDASMLLRYSQNLAAGHGIRWSLNQAPVDGATDFLYMALTAALSRLFHLSVITASRALNIAAQFASVTLVYTGARRLNAHRWLAASAALYLIAGPWLSLSTACFGAPFFAALLLACWHVALRYALVAPTRRNAILMSTFGLLAGLTRPEGVLIAAILLCATLYLTPKEDRVPHVSILRHGFAGSSTLLLTHALIFGTLGTAYFAWRWHYFGYPLPNPFYVKGDGHLYPTSVEHAAMNLVTLLLPSLPLIPLGWLSAHTRRLTNALVFVLIAFTLMWVLLSNQNNHFFRFQYAIVPLVLMTVPALANGIRDLVPESIQPVPTVLQRNVLLAAATLCTLGSMLYISHTFAYYNATEQGMRTFAQRLQPFASRGYTMAVTEAGALPLYSQWNTIDALGLNDTYIAHHHYLDRDYLDRTHPELIMVHIDSAFPNEFEPNGLTHLPTEHNVFFNAEYLNYYSASHNYTLAAIWGSDPCNLHLYWLQPNIPDYEAILSDIRDHPYYFLDNGNLAHDFRNEQDTLQACALPAPK